MLYSDKTCSLRGQYENDEEKSFITPTPDVLADKLLPGVNVVKHFFVVTDAPDKQIVAFVPGNPLQPSLKFVSKAPGACTIKLFTVVIYGIP
jgi:hypothetical protein